MVQQDEIVGLKVHVTTYRRPTLQSRYWQPPKMVLKKSNSGLNSGATQHVSRGGFVNLANQLYFSKRTCGELQVSVDLRYMDDTDHVDICLDQINDYLGWEGPKISGILNTNVHPANFRFRPNRESWLSLDKGWNWNLSDRLKKLMADVDFLKEITEHVEINVTEISEPLAGSRGQTSTKTQSSFQILKAFEAAEKEVGKPREADVKSKRRQTYHGRGVQRRYEHGVKDTVGAQDGQGEGHAQERKSSLNFTIYQPCEIDVRASQLCSRFDSFRGSQKSYIKRKGHVHGWRSRHRDNYFHIKSNIGDCISSAKERTGVLKEDENESEEDSLRPRCSYTLSDFVTMDRKVKRKQKKSKRSLAGEDPCNVDRLRQLKGSYILIQSDSDLSSASEESWEVVGKMAEDHDSHRLESGTDQTNRASVNGTECEDDLESEGSGSDSLTSGYHSVELEWDQRLEKELQQFADSFILVQAFMPGDGVSLFPQTLEHLHLNGKTNVNTGNCLPHCFCVSPEKHAGQSYVVGKRSSRDGRTWRLSLQSETRDHQATRFIDALFGLAQSDEHLPLTHVIKMAEEVLEEKSLHHHTTSKENELSVSINKQSNQKVWREVTKLLSHEIDIYTAEEAAKLVKSPVCHLDEKQSEKVVDSFTDGHLDVNDNIECGVCFSECRVYAEDDAESAMMLLPCKHAYCVRCWQAHVYYNIQTGAPRIECMTRGCSVLLNQTTLISLMPHAVVSAWRARLKDRSLQASEYANWCPDGRCGKVAVSSKTPLKKQFGVPLMCACLTCWCSNCQGEPHWPASCEQMAAYKKLLAKTGNDFVGPVGNATFSIDLKQCPRCHYPIEKNHGCASMVCRMCWFNFCWNCLKSTAAHNVYNCKASPSSHFVTFHMHNKLVYDLPIKFFMESVKANRQIYQLQQKASCIAKLCANLDKRLPGHRRLPTRLMLQTSAEDIVHTLSELTQEVMAFLTRVLTFTETFYVLLSFVQLSKSKTSAYLVTSMENKMSRLNFITDRLNTHTVGRSGPHILSVQKHVRVLLKTGAATLDQMFAIVPALQQASKDVDTAWAASIDPSKHLRYK
ncbi:E3 ubiquitin-protein ligase arih1 [Plakobranchus ocellatus]|uniref:E3 ubiquitin-protein ligase arih1 n=1 Tax=Plakobranchus ocellatus TaxID=259542 RepID=A0AAV4CM25_9GAST|nr:E3 ubiquitin-protein ligase arih1 [Plakobranchus ocellatus]